MSVMDLFMTTFMLVVIVVTAFYWGAWLSIKLPELDWRFDRKPFNCRPCLTFHFCWLMSVVVGIVLASGWWFAGGIGVSLVVFLIVQYVDNQKIDE